MSSRNGATPLLPPRTRGSSNRGSSPDPDWSVAFEFDSVCSGNNSSSVGADEMVQCNVNFRMTESGSNPMSSPPASGSGGVSSGVFESSEESVSEAHHG